MPKLRARRAGCANVGKNKKVWCLGGTLAVCGAEPQGTWSRTVGEDAQGSYILGQASCSGLVDSILCLRTITLKADQ